MPNADRNTYMREYMREYNKSLSPNKKIIKRLNQKTRRLAKFSNPTFKSSHLMARKLIRQSRPIETILKGLKQRAKLRGVEFNLTKEDIIIPDYCPVLGIELKLAGEDGYKKWHNAPSVDRLIPHLGYIKTNIIIVSYRANRIKCDATLDELKLIYNFYKKKIKI